MTQQLYSYFGTYICLVLDNLPLTHALTSSQFYISSLNSTPSYLFPHSYVHSLNHFVPHSSFQFSLPPLIPTPIPSFPSISLFPNSSQPHQVNWSQRWPGGVLPVESLHSGQTPLLVQAGMHPHHCRGTDTTHVMYTCTCTDVVCWLERLPKCLGKYTHTLCSSSGYISLCSSIASCI